MPNSDEQILAAPDGDTNFKIEDVTALVQNADLQEANNTL